MLLSENYSFVRQSLEVVGLTVFHTLWAGGLLLLLLMLVLRVVPTQLAKARFAVSLVALQLLFLLFLGVFLYQCHQLSPAAEPVDKTAAAPLPAVPTVLPSVSTTAEVNASPVPVPWLVRLQAWSRWWAALWLLGVAYHALQLLLGVRHTRQLRTKAQRVSDDWEGRFDRLKERLGIKQSVLFLRSDQTAVPLTFGWLKPVVLIPASLLTQLSPEQLEMIVLHELAHIRRHDYLWSLGQSVAEVVLFYHPAYWYIARVLEREREFACDQTTIHLTQQPHTYARTLLQVATTTTPNYGLAVSGKRGLSDRIKRIVNPAPGRSNGPVLPALILIGVIGVASATFALQWHHLSSGDSPKVQEQLADSTEVDYGPSFEEVMAQVSDETLDTTSLTLNEIYDNAITIDQYFNQLDRSLKEYAASYPRMHKDQPVSPVNYSSVEVLYLVDGLVRDPKSVRRSEVEEISVYRDLDKLTLEGIDLRGYSVMVTASSVKGKLMHPQDSSRSNQYLYLRNGWGKINPPPSNNAKSTNRWLYIADEQVQTNRPTFLDGDYQAAGWETRIVPAAGWWIKAYLTKEQ
ncbi:MAG: M56 family metallopeptidase [Tunicatimonas sp.]